MVALIAAVSATVVLPSPLTSSIVQACSCADPTTYIAELLASTDATFSGTVAEIRRPEVLLSSTAESRFVFEVDEVYAGEGVHARQSVVTATDGASCGIELPVGATAIVFARTGARDVTPDEGEFASSLCEVVAAPSAEVLSLLGTGRAPETGSSPIGADDGVASTAVRNWYWPVAIVAAVAAVAAFRRRRRRTLRV